MIESRSKLEKDLNSYLKRIIGEKKNIQLTSDYLVESYNFPMDMAYDIISLKVDLSDQTEFVLYCVTDAIGYMTSKYFTDQEIEFYSSQKFETKKIKLPITYKVYEVSGDQYIGVLSLQELMMLRDAQLIRYNENTQRMLTKIVNGSRESYRITVDKKQKKNIADALVSGSYIPDTITLNMPEDTEFSYSDGLLKISAIRYFDIIDGYHRYLAMSDVYNMNETFDYPIEIRIVFFREERAKQMIWQQDQKVHMKKVDSISFNQNSPGNKLAQMMSSAGGILDGVVGQRGVINLPYFASVIEAVYFTKTKHVASMKKIVETRKEIEKKLELILEDNLELTEEKWDTRIIACFGLASSLYDESEIVEQFNRAVSLSENTDLFKKYQNLTIDLRRLKTMIVND